MAEDRPNIVFIFTDQQSAHMMGCAGNPNVHTPAMDSLATNGARFARAYCSDPVCVPSRFSLMTGRMPSEIGLRSNETKHIQAVPDAIKQSGLGWLFRRAGYQAAYGGKQHLPKLDAKTLGFDYLTRDERDGLANTCVEFLSRKHDKPFLLVASFINPHDICYMAIRDFRETQMDKWLIEGGKREIAILDEALRLPEGVSEKDFFARHCPPVPPNFEPQDDEPEAIRRLLAQRPFRKNAREKWTPERWRMHRWAYSRLTERVDAQIAKVLEAVRRNGLQDNTVIIFSSDHGDHDSSHRMEHKTAFYEEAARIPLIVSQPGVTPAGLVDDTHLISNGLDLLPTLCDYAGIAVPKDLKGHSFRPLAEGRAVADWRAELPIESEIGRALVTSRYKYILYDEGASREQLMDLEKDPHETRNAAKDPGNEKIVAGLRARLARLSQP